MKTIGVAIPCFYGHISKMSALLQSIEKQTVLPSKVVISCSSSLPKDIPAFGKFSFELQIIVTPERKNAAENRNIAVQYLDTDLITFIDADDVMHPQRLEALQHVDADMVVHDFVCNYTHIFEHYAKFELEYDVLKIADNDKLLHIRNEQFAGAHVTVTKQVIETIKFNETKDFELSADTTFCKDIVKSGFKCAYIPHVLSKGDASFTCFFEQGIPVVITYSDKTVVLDPPKKPKSFGIGSLISR